MDLTGTEWTWGNDTPPWLKPRRTVYFIFRRIQGNVEFLGDKHGRMRRWRSQEAVKKALEQFEALSKSPGREAMFTVVPSTFRHYGYSIKAPTDITWAKGPGNTFGWYKRKRDAQQRCDVLNRARTVEQLANAKATDDE